MSNADPRLLQGGVVFTAGRARFFDGLDLGERNARIYIQVAFGSMDSFPLTVFAMVDTGAPWCILQSELAGQVGLEIDAQEEFIPLNVRGYPLRGQLKRHAFTIIAEEGDSLEVNSTVYLVDGDWRGPNFIGYEGLLQWIRFAVDPARNLFYFGRGLEDQTSA